MKLNQLKTLVKQGESETLEFKKTTANLHAAMETVCAFLNSDHGGKVLIGVNNDGKIIGQEVNDSHFQQIAAETRKIEPRTNIDIEYVTIKDNHKVIILSVDSGNSAPYEYDGRAFTRIQSTTSRMTQEEKEYLTHKNNPQRWETLTNNDRTINDLDKARIKTIVRMGIEKGRLPEEAITASTLNILKKLDLIVNDKLTNAAVILFCKNEKKQFRQSSMKLARFKGLDTEEFYDNKLIKSNAFDLYDKAMEFLHFNVPLAAKIVEGQSERVETPAIPYKVLREALTNAIVHKDYSNAGSMIWIARFDDRVNITNTGSLPKGIALKELSKEHKSFPRNPLIANVFYICGKIEGWGRGTIDMIKDCKKSDNPVPKYDEIGNSFSVTLPLKEPINNITLQQPSILMPKLTDRQNKILNILKNGPLSNSQIMLKLKSSVTDRTIRQDLIKLKEMGLISSEGKTKSVIWALR